MMPPELDCACATDTPIFGGSFVAAWSPNDNRDVTCLNLTLSNQV